MIESPGGNASDAIAVHEAVKRFGAVAVDRVSFAVPSGSAVGVVGPNGAGKTTLLNLIAGDLALDSGTIAINGHDVTRLRPERRAAMGLARTAQIPRPFEGLTTYENVLVGATFAGGHRRGAARDATLEALDRTGMLKRANTLAGALTLLDRKRLELARALATTPGILLLDEIAGGLTEGEVHDLVEMIGAIHAAGVTIVWIEHVVHALLAIVDRIVAMNFGVKIADGPAREVMSSAVVREVYLGIGEQVGTGELTERSDVLLAVDRVNAGYGDFQALFDLSAEVAAGSTVAIIGANGAGKSTLLRAVMGQVKVFDGSVHFEGRNLGGVPTHDRVAAGIALVPEGRRLFPSLTVEENLRIGAHCKRPGRWSVTTVLEVFPMLDRLLGRQASTLSGGEQQAVAIGRALMSNPALILLDEVSLGLAPVVVRDVYRALPSITAGGTTAVIVEQDISIALDVADEVYCLLEGRVALRGRPDELTRDDITTAYFGM